MSVLDTPTVPSPDAVSIFANSVMKVSVELWKTNTSDNWWWLFTVSDAWTKKWAQS